MRSRSRFQGYKLYNTNHGATYNMSLDNTTIYESNYPGSCNCEHWLVQPCSPGTVWDCAIGRWELQGRPGFVYRGAGTANGLSVGSPLGIIAMVKNLAPSPQLNWNKLLSSSELGLIQILAELDETIAMFTKKFIKQLSYGSVTWGVLPFVSELKATIQAIQRSLNRAVDAFQRYEDELTEGGKEKYTFSYTYSRYTFEIEYEAVLRHSGSITLPDGSLYLEILDRIGLHLNPETAWDLIPFSFVADYFLPIGQWLQTISNKGWIKAVMFEGWRTLDITGTYSGVDLQPVFPQRSDAGNYTCDCSAQTHKFSYFVRTRLSNSVLLDLPPDVSDFEGVGSGDLLELFNTFYLGMKANGGPKSKKPITRLERKLAKFARRI